MKAFRRVLGFLFKLVGFMAGVITAVSIFMVRMLIAPPRQRLWANPGDIGLDYDDVQFPAQDGIRLAGWFIPAQADSLRKGGTVVLVHGWPWNRLGDAADDMMANFTGATPVDLLRLAYGLHQEGFHVMMFDLRNHGESAAVPPVTVGLDEAKDVLGAVSYVASRPDVSAERIGVVGFSMGGNATLYALSQTDQIRAAVAVQPTTMRHFADRYGRYLFGPLSAPILMLTELLFKMNGGYDFASVRPANAASEAGNVPVLFVQGAGDEWGSVEDVEGIAALTPKASGPLVVETTHRYGGYQYVVDNPKILAAFFEQHFPE